MVSGWPTKFSATWHNTKSSTDSTEIENHAKHTANKFAVLDREMCLSKR